MLTMRKILKPPYVIAKTFYYQVIYLWRFLVCLPSTIKEFRRHPEHIRLWFRDRVDWRSSVDRGIPWLSYPCIEHLRDHMIAGMRVFEWGGGGSTVFFARLGCRIFTMESHPLWRKVIQDKVNAMGESVSGNVDIRFVPTNPNNPERMHEYIEQVSNGAPWDVILVDGWERVRCVIEAKEYLSTKGILIFDNADSPQFAQVPQILKGFRRLQFPGMGPGRLWPTQTDIYVTS